MTLDDVLAELGPQERMIVDLLSATHAPADVLRIALRVLGGQRVYGCFDLLRDTRDWEREAQEETDDRDVYVAAAEIQRRLRR